MSDLKTMYPGQVNSPFTTTLGEISTTDTAVVVADASVLPATVPHLLTLGYDKSASETVLVTAVSGNTLTIVRAVDGPALLWVAGTKAARIFTAKDLNDIQENIRALNEDKQEKLTIDAAPKQGSSNPVSSGGVHSALAGKQPNLTFDATPTQNSQNPVTSGGIFSALAEKQPNLTFDAAPKQNSQNPVTSGGVFSALAGKQPNLTFDATPTQNSQNPVTSGGVHTALSAKANAASLASHTGNTANPHKVTAAQIGAATPAEISTAIDDISCVGDLRTTIGVPSENWLLCDGSGVMEADYPALVPLLGQNVKRWSETKSASTNFYFENGKLLLAGTDSIFEYVPATESWVEHTGVTDYGSISCVTYHDGTWIVASSSLVMYVYTSDSLDGPWEKHGSYASMSTIYPTRVIPKGDGGLIVAGYNFNCYLGVGILTADFQWSYTLFNQTDKFDSNVTLKHINTYWIVCVNALSGQGAKPWIFYTTDPATPMSSWNAKQILSTTYWISDIAYFNGKWVVSLYQNSSYSYGIRIGTASELSGSWSMQSVDTNANTPYVFRMFVSDGMLYATGYRNGLWVLRAASLTSWAYQKLSTESLTGHGIYRLNGELFVHGYKSSTSGLIARISDVTRDLSYDAALPNITPSAGKTYIKAK